jgi:hypothetical protein
MVILLLSTIITNRNIGYGHNVSQYKILRVG